MNVEAAGPRIDLVGSIKTVLPGLVLCATIALASSFVSDHHGGPTLLYALLLGMAFYFLSKEAKTRPGIEFASRTVLRVGVALLGAKITVAEILGLGWQPVIVVMVAVISTICFGVLLSRWLGLSREFGFLSGGATAICGASAAMAISATLPQHENSERDTLFTVIVVTTLSTTAMIVYPLVAQALGMNETEAGIFLGATIHDVAQVVGAAFMLSDTTGHVATFTKLFRVALLVPAVVVIGFIVARGSSPAIAAAPVRLPGFLIAFVAIVLVNSVGLVPMPVQNVLSELSRTCLVIAIAGLGIKTSFQELAKVGWRPALLMIGETVFLAMLVAAMIALE